jgi:Holliday junction resolvase
LQIYESDTNRKDQDRLAWCLENYGFRVEQTSTLCQWDFRVYLKDKLYALVEYKAREKHFDPIFVSKQKVDQLVHAAKQLNAKPMFIVGCKGPPYMATHLHTNHPVETFQRTKGDRGDRPEPCYAIPKSNFIWL